MKILLIGKSGQLGGDLLRNGAGLHEIYAPGRDLLDLEDAESLERQITAFHPDVVINTAAFHNVPLCEEEPAKSFAVNCLALRDLGRCCREVNAWLVTFSTDYVFGGEKRTPYFEEDRPAPLQIYGISKLAGEYCALAAWPLRTMLIRTCGLYGCSGARSKGGNFVDNRIQEARSKKVLEMGMDQVVSPTWTDDLSKAVLQLIGKMEATPGIYHLVNEGECSWFEFTKAIYEIMGFEIEVKPVDRKGRSGEMRRPLYSVLGNRKARKLGIILPPWRDALARYLQAKYAERNAC